MRKSFRSLNHLSTALPAALAVLVLVGCSTGGQTAGPRYEGSQQVDSLEIPPDLIAPGMERAYRIPDVPGERVSARELEEDPRRATPGPVTETAMVLPDSPFVELRRDGQTRWLHVEAPPDALWPELRQFWRQQNLAVTLDEPAAGIMETEWAENRAGIPVGAARGWLSRAIGSVYDAGTRDQYRLRVERRNGATEVFISHRGAVERGEADGMGARWFITEPDPELEAQMLNRLLVFLTTGEISDTVAIAEEADFERTGQVDLVERDGRLVLEMRGEPDALWRRLGLALDRTGLMVDEQDRRTGTYLVTYRPDVAGQDTERPGMFRRMFGGGGDAAARIDQRYQLRMIEDGRELQVEVLSIEGERLSAADERFVLETIQPQLR
jgi:outer membrane protein assembly factor BamC